MPNYPSHCLQREKNKTLRADIGRGNRVYIYKKAVLPLKL